MYEKEDVNLIPDEDVEALMEEILRTPTSAEMEEMYRSMGQPEEPVEMAVLFEGSPTDEEYPMCTQCGRAHMYAWAD